MLAFPFERPMFMREFSTGTYGAIAYFIAKVILLRRNIFYACTKTLSILALYGNASEFSSNLLVLCSRLQHDGAQRALDLHDSHCMGPWSCLRLDGCLAWVCCNRYQSCHRTFSTTICPSATLRRIFHQDFTDSYLLTLGAIPLQLEIRYEFASNHRIR